MSSQPGWYPDPAGTPQSYRWWDGRAWTNATTQTPSQPGPGQPGRQPGRPPGRRRTGLWVLLAVVLAVGVLAAFVLPRLGSGTPASGDEPSTTVSGWNETSEPSTPPPSTATSAEPTRGGSLVACPVGDPSARQSHPVDDRLHGGGLSIARVPRWVEEPVGLTWTYDLAVQTDEVQQGWFSLVSVGALSIADGFTTPRQAALGVFDCMASSGFYEGYTGRTMLSSQAYSVGAASGWRVRGEVYVADQGPAIPGDTLDIVVLNTGSAESLGMFMSAVTIGDTQRAALAQAALESLAVD